MSISEALKAYFLKMEDNNEFSIGRMIWYVRIKTRRFHLDSTVLSELRRQRLKGKLNYLVVDERIGLYKKIG